MNQTSGDSKKMDIVVDFMSLEKEDERGIKVFSYGEEEAKNIFPNNVEIKVENNVITFDEKKDEIRVKTEYNTEIINFPNLKEKREEEKLHSKISEKGNKTINYNKNKNNNTERAV